MRGEVTAAEAQRAPGGSAPELHRELEVLAARARTTACKLRVDGALRERARTGRYA